ncbi:MAG: NUDIX hydrolase [Clostridium sp.]|uniref:NUDIX hydrolase n=1 Tax=Clostridium sp. TaxID=1506 RepID=UPI003EE6098D
MENINGCYVLLKDDFGNILLVQKGKKKNPGKWQLVGRNKKGKESNDKCINNSIKEDLNTLIFDLEEYKSFNISETDNILVFTGKIKDFMNHGKNVVTSEWISKSKFETLDTDEITSVILKDFFTI